MEGMVQGKAYHSKHSQGPHQMKQNLAAPAPVPKIREHIARPCQHCKKHEHKVKDCQTIYIGEKRVNFPALVQKAPAHVHDKVAAGGKQKPIVANARLHWPIRFFGVKSVVFEQFPVQY
jgi:hypothetical protein